MSIGYTSLLALVQPVDGTEVGTWGDDVNNGVSSILDVAVAGTQNLTTDANVTLTITQATSSGTNLTGTSAQYAIILLSGARTATRTVTLPASSKTYTVINSTTGGFAQTVGGLTIAVGEVAKIVYNIATSAWVKASTFSGAGVFSTVTATAATSSSSNLGAFNYGTLNFSDTGIVQSAQTSVNSYFQNVIQNTSNGTAASAEFIAYNDQGTATTNYATAGINSSGYSGTGSINAAGYGYFLTGSTDLVLGTIGANGIHFTTNSSATDALAISSAGAVSFPGGTANGVGYLNGSKQFTTGSALTFDGTNLGVGLAPFSFGSYAGISVGAAAGGALSFGTGGSEAGRITGQSGYLNFYGGTVGSVTELMRLTTTGLGIGTSSPLAKLHTSGSGTVSNYITTSDSGGVNLYLQVSGSAANIGSPNGVPLTFTTANTVKATLDTSGNLGLGVTPSAWTSKAMQIGSGGSGISTVNGTEVVSNAYYASGSWYRVVTAAASWYSAEQSGAHKWYTAPSGTAGTAITFTQALTLDASGNLLVGATSQINGDKVGVTFNGQTQNGIVLKTTYATLGSSYILFYNSAGSLAGQIAQNGTTTVSYGTSSDYRLKNITGPVTNSGAYIDSLNPVEGTWKVDGSTFVGLIAHEAQEVSRTNVASGVKDGEQMQTMDYSSAEIIANMIAELKSLRKRVFQLESA